MLPVVGWATSYYFVGAIQKISKAKDLLANFNKGNVSGKKGTVTDEASVKKADLDSCPSVSPYLKGKIKLVFKPDLTLEEVQAENPKVHRGRYHPEECRASQRVAILIPHRNREKHLLYLLKHLHPFLQRQQLEYGVYIIHQAGSKKFNRAKLLNVGYLEALKEENWDCFIFHDVDLVPENDLNLYKCEDQPKHLVVGRNSTGYRTPIMFTSCVRSYTVGGQGLLITVFSQPFCTAYSHYVVDHYQSTSAASLLVASGWCVAGYAWTVILLSVLMRLLVVRLRYSGYFGGVTALSREQFFKTLGDPGSSLCVEQGMLAACEALRALKQTRVSSYMSQPHTLGEQLLA
ncbi:beta-1,4-galactosyltransferase 4 [Camelus ferus]|nr:beta-1,4-galactosyltransferase 4 [Camelus ferus]